MALTGYAMRSIMVAVAVFLLAVTPSMAAPEQPDTFKRYNADIDKYAFTRSFIVSVSYYKRVSDRLKAEIDYQSRKKSDIKLILKYIQDRTLDNTELRIARNYLTKFTDSGNGLIRKVSGQAIAAYDAVLSLSMRERELWVELHRFKSTGQPADFNEEQFNQKHLDIIAEKKEADKQLLSASVLMRIVLLSASRCENENCKLLVLTDAQRRRLSQDLDEYARDNMEWGLKAGQSPVDGCVAAIREVLEDKLYSSAP
jgi:hypothetical protein